MVSMGIIPTERRGRYGDVDKAALLAEVDVGGCTIAEVAWRHGMAESLLYNWRANRRSHVSIASRPLQFIAYSEGCGCDYRAAGHRIDASTVRDSSRAG